MEEVLSDAQRAMFEGAYGINQETHAGLDPYDAAAAAGDSVVSRTVEVETK